MVTHVVKEQKQDSTPGSVSSESILLTIAYNVFEKCYITTILLGSLQICHQMQT